MISAATVVAAPAVPGQVPAMPGPALASNPAASVPSLPPVAGRVPSAAAETFDKDTAQLSASLTAHIESVVNDARRNADQYGGR